MPLIQPIEIGSVRTATNLILSPMSGVTDCAFRRLVRRCSGDAVGLLVSEFIAAEGLTRASEKSFRMLRFHESERPFSIQIFGADVDRMAQAAQIVEQAGADIVDINCGCPAPKVVRRGGGADLLRQVPRLRAIVRAVRRRVRIPVTVKIRSGWDGATVNALEVARAVEGEGASMLAIHGRTRVQLYRGQADWDLVERVHAILTIPVVGSGDITSAERSVAQLARNCADGLMIGRAAMDNPWIFAQALDLAARREPRHPGAKERIAALRYFAEVLCETLPERAYLARVRGLACRFVKGMRSGAAARRRLGACETIDDIVARFSEFVLHEDDTAGRALAVA